VIWKGIGYFSTGKGVWPIRQTLRGGSWNNKPENLRCSARNNNNPDNRNNNNGFRVVRPNHVLSFAAVPA